MLDLFADTPPWQESLAPGAVILRRRALAEAALLIEGIAQVTAQSPFRQMVIPRSHIMSVAMSNCGDAGWSSDTRGYRYLPEDPQTGQTWPAMPSTFLSLALACAKEAGYADFQPDACLINRYAVGAKMSLHQDKDEKDLLAPIVSVSLGLPAIFLFGGHKRSDPTQRCLLEHGDVVVWGGVSRLNFHGVQPLKAGINPLTGEFRFNLTFRQSGNRNKNKNYS